jgi:hypothetical protein
MMMMMMIIIIIIIIENIVVMTHNSVTICERENLKFYLTYF